MRACRGVGAPLLWLVGAFAGLASLGACNLIALVAVPFPVDGGVDGAGLLEDSGWDSSADAISPGDSSLDVQADVGGDSGSDARGDSASDASSDASDASDANAAALGDAAVTCMTDAGTYADNGIACATSGGTQCWNGACVIPMHSCTASAPGTTNCGDSGVESCCTSLEVDGGAYDRTYTYGADAATDLATVSDFRMDKYLVTVGRFRQFVKAWADGGGYVPPPGSGKHTQVHGGLGLEDAWDGSVHEPGWNENDNASVAPTETNLACGTPYASWTPDGGPAAQENLPITCVSWQEAYAFCIWDGAFLPTEAEWEYVAAGGSEQREYPWGSTPPGSSAAYAIYSPTGSLPSTYPGPVGAVPDVAPVGTATLGVGAWGQLDMAGEVWQWSLDWYAPSYGDPCVDCTNVTNASSGYREIRGGDFLNDSSFLLPPMRYPPSSYRFYNLGFRCARTP